MAFDTKALKDTVLANVGSKASRSAARASIDSANKSNFDKLTKPARDQSAAESRTKAVSASVSQSAREATQKLSAASKPATSSSAYPTYKKGSTQAQSFNSAFAAARKSGAKEFSWEGRKYNTKVK